MGAYEFENRVKADSAQEAFRKATDQARFEHGHGGYTGTIAEKSEFRLMTPPDGMSPAEYVRQLGDQSCEMPVDPRITGFNPYDDKWGPAGCVDMGDGSFTFFGIASS